MSDVSDDSDSHTNQNQTQRNNVPDELMLQIAALLRNSLGALPPKIQTMSEVNDNSDTNTTKKSEKSASIPDELTLQIMPEVSNNSDTNTTQKSEKSASIPDELTLQIAALLRNSLGAQPSTNRKPRTDKTAAAAASNHETKAAPRLLERHNGNAAGTGRANPRGDGAASQDRGKQTDNGFGGHDPSPSISNPRYFSLNCFVGNIRPDIAYVVGVVSQFTHHHPQVEHMEVAMRMNRHFIKEKIEDGTVELPFVRSDDSRYSHKDSDRKGLRSSIAQVEHWRSTIQLEGEC